MGQGKVLLAGRHPFMPSKPPSVKPIQLEYALWTRTLAWFLSGSILLSGAHDANLSKRDCH